MDSPGTHPKVVVITAVSSTMRAFLVERFEALREAGYDLTLISSPGADLDLLEKSGFRCIRLRIPRAARPVELIRALWRLHRIFRTIRPDIIHTHTPIAAFMGQSAALAAGVKVRVNTVHGLFFVNVQHKVLRWLYRTLELLACRFATHVICDSGEDVVYFREQCGFPAAKLMEQNVAVNLQTVSPEAVGPDARVQIRREFDLPPDAFVFGTIARMVREKGLVELFEAFGRLAERYPNIYMLHVGPADNSRADGVGQAELTRGPYASRCRFTGQRYDIGPLLAAMDLFVLPSHREGYPVSAMEAAAMSLPCILTDIRGCREAVVQGETGLIVPVRNAEAIERAMEQLLLDADLRGRMGQAALARARERFDRHKAVQRTLGLYAKALAAARR